MTYKIILYNFISNISLRGTGFLQLTWVFGHLVLIYSNNLQSKFSPSHVPIKTETASFFFYNCKIQFSGRSNSKDNFTI